MLQHLAHGPDSFKVHHKLELIIKPDRHMKEHCRLSELLRWKSVVGSSREIDGSLDALLCDWELKV